MKNKIKKLILIQMILSFTTNVAWANSVKDKSPSKLTCAVFDKNNNSSVVLRIDDMDFSKQGTIKTPFKMENCDHDLQLKVTYRALDDFMLISLSDLTTHIEAYTSDAEINGKFVHLTTDDYSLDATCVVQVKKLVL